VRVVIAEDSAVVRAGLIEILLDRGHVVPAAVGDGDALIEAVAQHHPDVAIIDVRMPPTHTAEGLRAAVALRRTHPHLPLLVFSQHIETRHVEELLAGPDSGGVAGVGYLLKDRVADVEEFLDALDRVDVYKRQDPPSRQRGTCSAMASLGVRTFGSDNRTENSGGGTMDSWPRPADDGEMKRCTATA